MNPHGPAACPTLLPGQNILRDTRPGFFCILKLSFILLAFILLRPRWFYECLTDLDVRNPILDCNPSSSHIIGLTQTHTHSGPGLSSDILTWSAFTRNHVSSIGIYAGDGPADLNPADRSVHCDHDRSCGSNLPFPE